MQGFVHFIRPQVVHYQRYFGRIYFNLFYPEIIKIIESLAFNYNENPTAENYLKLLYNVPVGFMLTAGMTTNYRQLKTIYAQRKNHRLPEWREFCQWIETLPMCELIIGGKKR